MPRPHGTGTLIERGGKLLAQWRATLPDGTAKRLTKTFPKGTTKTDAQNWLRKSVAGEKHRLDVEVIEDRNRRPPQQEIPEPLRPIAGLVEIVPEVYCGIYFLVAGTKIMYIGQSRSAPNRIRAHKDKYHDKVLFLPTPKSKLTMVEEALIWLFRPPYNVSVQTDKDYAPLLTLRKLGFSAHDLERLVAARKADPMNAPLATEVIQ